MGTLPQGFLVGASTSAHQTEGNNIASDWWMFENQDGLPLQRSGDACDSFERWQEDLDIIAAAGLNAYRFSVEWARIEPSPGEFSLSAIDHYRRMIVGAKARGIEPVITLHHFTNPAWFTLSGGWLAPDAADRFAAYVDAIMPILADGVDRVVTINEPNMVAIMHRVFTGEVSLDQGLGGLLPLPHEGVRDVLIAVHQRTAAQLHAVYPSLAVGWSVAGQTVQSVAGGEALADAYRDAVEDVWVRAGAHDDFLGVQCYTRTVFGPEGRIDPAPDAPRTTTGWEYYPESLGESLRHTHELIPGVPLLVTENGIATEDDTQRAAYVTTALAGLSAALDDGIDVRGYLHWSLLDNFEWGNWGPRFGLVAVDRKTFERTPKPSLEILATVARTGEL